MHIEIATVQDTKAIHDIYKPYVEKTNITFEYDVPSVEIMQQRIVSTLKMYPYLVAKIDEQVVGYAYASAYKERRAYDWGCELSVYVDEKYHRHGIAKALYYALLEILKQMNIQTVYACLTYPNEKSEKFHKSFGFIQIALFEKSGYKFNQWHDMIWMQKKLGNYQEVKEVIRFSQLDIKSVEACLKK